MTIDELLPADHPARAVWHFAEGLDLTLLYDRIRSRGAHAGRPALDPRLLAALWLYATRAGVCSANALAKLCVYHDAYFWLAGGIAVNAHTLSDFHVQEGDFLEQMLAHSVTVLRQQGWVALDRVAQDGVRVRASAGAASFHRQATVEQRLREAQQEVARLQKELADSGPAHARVAPSTPVPDGADAAVGQRVASAPPPGTAGAPPERTRQEAAQMRQALAKREQAEQALERLPEMEAKKKPEDKA